MSVKTDDLVKKIENCKNVLRGLSPMAFARQDFYDVFDAALSSTQPPQDGWRSTDTKPPDFVDVLVFFDNGDFEIANWDTEAGWWSLPNSGFSHPDADPTYWMPITQPTKTDGDKL